MILLCSKFNTSTELTTDIFFERLFASINGMHRAPEAFKNKVWNNKHTESIFVGKNSLEYEYDEDSFVTAFRLGIVDEADALWTTDYIFDSIKKELQVRLARETNIISTAYKTNFHLPYFFRHLITDGYGGSDGELPVNDKPIMINGSNYETIVKVINGINTYDLPIVYVSRLFSGEYELDVRDLAIDLGGIAHVLVEESADVSSILREETYDRNPYNGAVEIFFDDGSLRFLRYSDINKHKFRMKVSQAIYQRVSMQNIDADNTIGSIRLRKKQKAMQDEDEFHKELYDEYDNKINEYKNNNKALSDRIKDLERALNSAEASNQALKEQLKRKNSHISQGITLDYSEEEFYEGEIKNAVLGCIRKVCAGCGDDERKRRNYHILMDIINNNYVSETGENVRREILEILKKGSLNKRDTRRLEELGFEISGTAHDKIKFHGDDRYTVTVASTPSDYRTGENVAHDAINLLFG